MFILGIIVGLLIAVLCFISQMFLVKRGFTVQSVIQKAEPKAEFIEVKTKDIVREEKMNQALEDGTELTIDDIL